MTVEQGRERSMRRAAIFRFVPLFIWIGVIFFMSSSQGSMSETSRFIRPILKLLFPDAAEFTLQLYHGYIRKFAHLFEYAVLAILASITFLRSTSPFLGKYFWAAALLLVILVAASDEFNQSFDQLRTSSIWDVLLDAAGGAFGVAAVYLTVRFGRRRNAVHRSFFR